MAKVLQRLDILLFANTAQYRSEMRDTQDSTRTMFGAMQADAVKLGKVGAAAFAGMAAAGTVAIGVLIKEQIELAGEMTTLAKVSNTGVESMQKLAVAAKAVGVEQDTLGDIYKDTQDKIGDFLSTGGGGMADFFENIAPQIGYTADQFRELSGPDALQLYYNGLQEANLSQSELIFYMEAMASDASALIPLLHDNGAGFKIWAEAAENAGAVMDESTIRATRELHAANDLMMLSIDGAKKQFTSAFIPVLADVADQLVGSSNAADIARQSGDFLVKTFKILTITGIGVVTVVKTIGTAIGAMGAVLAQWGNITDGVDFSSPFAFFQLAKNAIIDIPTAQINILKMAVSDVSNIITTANRQANAVEALGTGSRGANRYVVAAQNQRELRRQLGATGQAYQAQQVAAEAAAKASEKSSASSAKAAKKNAEAQARLVAISGNTGIGSGAHLDIRYARGDKRYGTEVTAATLARFEANGKAVTSYPKTSGFGPRNTGIPGASDYHLGTDFGMKQGTQITTKVAVKDVKAWYDKKGGGYVTDVTFADGVKVSLLHQMSASKNIKGGSSGTASNSYSQATSAADQLFKEQAAAAERYQADQTRLAEQQAKQRANIRMEYANEVVRIETQLEDKIATINASGFADDERLAFITDAEERARIDVANYEDAQAKKLAAFSDFTRTEALEFIKQKAVYELNQLDLTHDQAMHQAQQIEQTESERIRNQYALERREIVLTINMDEQLRKAKIDSLNQAEMLALEELRYAHERELQQLTSLGKSELDILRQSYADQRNEIDRRTDISDLQKSDLRDLMAGAQIYDTNQLQTSARDPFEAQQADIGGYSQQYGLDQKYKQQLTVIENAKKAELLTVETYEKAKFDAQNQYQQQTQAMMLGSAGEQFGAVTEVMRMAFGEQNAMHQAAFIFQKGLAIGQALLNIPESYSKAFNAVVGIPIVGPVLAPAAGVAAAALQVAQKVMIEKVQPPSPPGFETGGYTGNGGTSDVAGLVHYEEFVSTAPTTRKYRPELEAMHNGTYDKKSKPGVNINITNNAPVDISTRVNSNGDIDMRIDQRLAKQLPNAMAGQVNTSGSPVNKALINNYNMERRF